MSDLLGQVSYERPRQPMFLPENYAPGKNYSEAKAAQIDEEVTRFIEEAHRRVRKILSVRRTVLDDLAHLLSEKESVQGEELKKMLSEAAPAVAALSPGPLSRGIAGKKTIDADGPALKHNNMPDNVSPDSHI